MGKKINVSVTFNVVIAINEGVDVKEFIFRETEWLGEPKSGNGCVVAINPKSFEILNKERKKNE